MILYIQTIFYICLIQKAICFLSIKQALFLELLSSIQTKIARNTLRFVFYQSISGKSLASILGVMLCPGPSAQ